MKISLNITFNPLCIADVGHGSMWLITLVPAVVVVIVCFIVIIRLCNRRPQKVSIHNDWCVNSDCFNILLFSKN